MAIHDFLGTAGVALIVAMYFLLQTGLMGADNPHFSIWNAVGSVLILISLYYQFNLSAVQMEAFWLAISVYGFVRVKRAA